MSGDAQLGALAVALTAWMLLCHVASKRANKRGAEEEAARWDTSYSTAAAFTMLCVLAMLPNGSLVTIFGLALVIANLMEAVSSILRPVTPRVLVHLRASAARSSRD